ncbi:MAG: hypothetical protein ACLTBV_19385 [Enterocloster bolteae]
MDDNGDHIPDEYQIKVTYSAVNGSVGLKEAQYVTLYKDDHYATKEEGGVWEHWRMARLQSGNSSQRIQPGK